MNLGSADKVARALLYEGYVLYPYRPSSLKNRQRWMFGTLYPPAFAADGSSGDRSSVKMECLVIGSEPQVEVGVRFLELVRTEGGARDDSSSAVERSVDAGTIRCGSGAAVASSVSVESANCVVRVETAAEPLSGGVWKLRVSVANGTDVGALAIDRSSALHRSLISAHVVLGCRGGRFVSLYDPPQDLAGFVSSLTNDGLWPVLVGSEGAADVLLASPIILYDYPRVAPESAGDFFDSTEIDELLTLRILTLTEDERLEVLRADPKCRALLERTEALDEATLASLHGAWRQRNADEPTSGARARLGLDSGDRVIVRPRPNGDVLDLVLAGEIATVSSVEEDFEGRIFFGVTIDSDPGRDFGQTGQPGHRFFFEREELEKIR